MTDPTLQAYYDAHDAMMNAERHHNSVPVWWAQAYGLYKIAREAVLDQLTSEAQADNMGYAKETAR